jgi:putative transposase
VYCTILIHDRDSKFGPEFDGAFKEFGVDQTRLPYRSPTLNAHVERFIKTLEVECLDRFIVMGTKHLDHLVSEFADLYNRQRPHSGIGGATPMRMSRAGPTPSDSSEMAPPDGRVCCQKRLGGVLKHY